MGGGRPSLTVDAAKNQLRFRVKKRGEKGSGGEEPHVGVRSRDARAWVRGGSTTSARSRAHATLTVATTASNEPLAKGRASLFPSTKLAFLFISSSLVLTVWSMNGLGSSPVNECLGLRPINE